MQGLKQEIKTKILASERPIIFTTELELAISEHKRYVWLTIADVVQYDGSHVIISS
jgi:hypothetical protein